MKIIHVVPPSWSGGNQSEDKQMKSLLIKVLKTCDDLGMASISVPALRCGKQGFPVDKATFLIVQTVAEYISDGKSKIKEVVLCDTSNTFVENFTNAICSLKDPWFVFKHGSEIKAKDSSSIDRRSGGIGHTVTESKSQRTPGDLKMPSGPPSATLRWGRGKRQVRESHEKIPEHLEINEETIHSQLTVDTNIFRSGLPFNIPISDKIHLKIEQGNLATEKVDVIVNTTSDFPNLNGEVAKAIIFVGGESIIQECKQLGNIKEGEIRTSHPGRLPCNSIFHVLIPKQWNAKTGELFVYQMVINCLELATQQRHNSIAFPVIGAGKTGFPADIVAKAMVKAACDFASQTSNSAVTNVSIVVYSKADSICKIFEKAVPSLFRASSARKTIRHGRSHQHQKVIEASVDYIAPYSKHAEVDDVVIIKVISKNRGKIIQKYIEKLVEEKYTTRKISFKNLSKEYTLTSLEENKIKDLGIKFGIDVQVIQKECCVQLSGLADLVNTCELELVGLLHNEFPALRLGRKEEEGIAGAEQWFYEQDGTSNKVDMSSNFEIRKGHLEKNDFSYYNHAEQREYTVHYVMDGQMEEWPCNDPQKKRRLYLPKQAESGVSYPATWTIFQNDVSEAQDFLAEHEAEFNEVKNKLIKDGCRPTQIVAIKRLENKFLWKQYQLKKAHLEKLNPQTEIEKRLWHGTKVATVDIIIKHGYNRSFAGEANMTSYGKGVYFAAKSSYSDNDIYATPDAAGVKRMFLNRVLTGVYCRGHQHLISPPERPGMIADGYKVCYDSAVDDEKNPTVFVMFHDTQVFPEYLIEYKR